MFRAHVDLIFQKFDDDPGFSIESLDIAVNAVATAVKDFFFKRLPPLLPQVSKCLCWDFVKISRDDSLHINHLRST